MLQPPKNNVKLAIQKQPVVKLITSILKKIEFCIFESLILPLVKLRFSIYLTIKTMDLTHKERPIPKKMEESEFHTFFRSTKFQKKTYSQSNFTIFSLPFVFMTAILSFSPLPKSINCSPLSVRSLTTPLT